MSDPQRPITTLLKEAQAGDRDAFEEVMPHIYGELRRIAHQRLAKHRPSQTLNTTALVHEAYLRLVNQTQADWQDRAHFFAVASRAMRFIIIDYVRARTAEKRGGAQEDVPLNDVQVAAADERAADLLTLNDALEQLAEVNERLCQLVEYRFFGGLTYQEIAEVTGRSIPTVKRDWARARTWLYRALQPDSDSE